MKKILLVLGAVVVLLILAIVGVGYSSGTAYAVDTSITISAPAEKVHVYVGHLDRWPDWAPWKDMDPTMEVTTGEKNTGVGASQTWTGDSGSGELTFTLCDPAKGIAYDMVFIDGENRMPADCAMTYTTEGESTVVRWTMEGDLADTMPRPLAGLMSMVMESTIPPAFDQGLAKLKAEVEAAG